MGQWSDADYVRWFLAIGGTANFLYGIFALARSVYRREKWHAADGRIVDLKEVRSSGQESTATAHAPVISFRTRAGTEHTFRNPIAVHSGHYQVGYTMKVLYDPDHPDRAILEDGFTLWGGALIGMGSGALFGLIAWLMW